MLYGLKEANTPVEDIQSVLDIITNKLKINCQFSDIRDVYRLGKPEQQKVRPVSIELVSYKLKLEILNKTKELKGTNIFISIDYTVEEYQKRKVLLHHLKIAKGNNYLAIIKNNVLFVDGEAYTQRNGK